eukprot:6968582-Lingulodinium_polyedra.AAC.1
MRDLLRDNGEDARAAELLRQARQPEGGPSGVEALLHRIDGFEAILRADRAAGSAPSPPPVSGGGDGAAGGPPPPAPAPSLAGSQADKPGATASPGGAFPVSPGAKLDPSVSDVISKLRKQSERPQEAYLRILNDYAE